MYAKGKKISAFVVKNIEQKRLPEKEKKSKHKSSAEPNIIDVDASKPDQTNNEVGKTKKRKKRSKKSKQILNIKVVDETETDTKSKSDTADAQKVDSIEISDEDSNSCVIVGESSGHVVENLYQVGPISDKVEERQFQESSGNVERRSRKRGKRQRHGSESRDNTEPENKSQDPYKRDVCESADKRKQKELDNEATPCANKKSRTDFDRERPGKSVNETSGWRTFGSRMREEYSYDLNKWPDESEYGNIGDTDVSVNDSLVAIPVTESVLVIAAHPCMFPLKGRIKVQALVGEASIMGYHLIPGKESCDVFSPDCNSLLTINTVTGQTNTKKSVQKVVSSLHVTDSSVLTLLHDTLKVCKPFVILKFDKLETNLCSFISNFHPYTNIFKVDGDRSILNKQLLPLEVIVPKDPEVPMLNVTDTLKAVMDEWKMALEKQGEDQPVMMICGGKDSGKSTTNRLLINSSLNLLDHVYYLECDIGQSEFTPPGVVSLVEVTSPVLGPPFTHQRQTVCSYHFGSVTPKDNPDLYMQCVQLCVQKYRHIEKPGPLIVNTMGWMKGLGWQLLLDTVRLVSPSIIVQLMSNQNSQNVASLTVLSLKETSWTDFSQMYEGPVIERRMERIPKIKHLEVPVATSYNFRMKSTDYRNMSILCHLGDNLEPGLTLTSMTPYTVSWKDVAIHMCHVEVSRSQVMYALNANLVALCEGDITQAEKVTDDGPLFFTSKAPCKWVGYGLVRGIDMEKKLIYVITSLNEEDLARVTVLDISGVSVPENFLIAQKCERLVYVDEVVESVGLSAVRPRKHMPRKSLRGNIKT